MRIIRPDFRCRRAESLPPLHYAYTDRNTCWRYRKRNTPCRFIRIRTYRIAYTGWQSCILLCKYTYMLQRGEGRRRKLGQRKILHIQIEFSRYLLLRFAMGLGCFSDASAKIKLFIFKSMMCLRGYLNSTCSQRERKQLLKMRIKQSFN